MQFRLFYTDVYAAIKKGLPRTGTAVELNNLNDLEELAHTYNSLLIIHYDLPSFLQWKVDLWGDDWTLEYKDVDLKEEHLVELPTKEWLSCQWIEVYNGYRE
jgi:hypothetical protein